MEGQRPAAQQVGSLAGPARVPAMLGPASGVAAAASGEQHCRAGGHRQRRHDHGRGVGLIGLHGERVRLPKLPLSPEREIRGRHWGEPGLGLLVSDATGHEA
jgi:hypothetical protein